MPSLTRITTITVLALTAIGTLYVYWTRTPQYTLLHVFNAYAEADHEAADRYLVKESPVKPSLHGPRPTENVIRHLVRLQNETLARAYRVTVEDSRLDGKTAELHVRLNDMPYRLRFHEQQDGRWKLVDFETREAFSEQAVMGMKAHPFTILARL